MFIPKPDDAQFELPPAGTHLAICYRVIDLGTQNVNWKGQAKRQHKIMISWEMPDEKMADGRPFTMSKRYTWSMSEKANLRADLESWRGVPFTENDFGANGFDIKNIISKACLLTIIQEAKEGKTYANIKAIGKPMKGMTIPNEITNERAYLWLHTDRWSAEAFHKLSATIQATIMASPEYMEMVKGDEQPQPTDADDFHNDDVPF